jgi:dihydroorotate dehydrogenase electron transfer subunit
MKTSEMPARVVRDFTLESLTMLGETYGLLSLKADGPIPAVRPGQFAQVRIDRSSTTFLRRPISICSANAAEGRVELLVRRAGAGTDSLLRLPVGSMVNLLLPLGNGFTVPEKAERLLLVGGGVGVAPMMSLGLELKARGFNPEFILGARTEADLLLLERFKELGEVYVTTDDGSAGVKGVVTAHPRMQQPSDMVYCCGPKPMMVAVSAAAARVASPCEVSLENMMACGLGACLCCVEKTVRGNVCVCTEGPVFNSTQLTWHD